MIERIQRIQRIADFFPYCLTIVDVKTAGRPCIFVNDKFVENTGFQPEEAIGRNLSFLQGKLTQKDTGVYKIAYTDGLGHYDSSRQIIITKSPFQKPPTPNIVRDSAGNLTSNYATGNQWYKDGVAIAGATDVKYKPLVNASYTVTTVQNGCASLKGSSYFFLVTDIINLEDNQFIKVMPNPYVSNLYLNFFLIKYNTLNADIFDFSTGRMVANRRNLNSGTNLDVATLSSGIYLVRVYSTDFKMTYTFKIVKL